MLSYCNLPSVAHVNLVAVLRPNPVANAPRKFRSRPSRILAVTCSVPLQENLAYGIRDTIVATRVVRTSSCMTADGSVNKDFPRVFPSVHA